MQDRRAPQNPFDSQEFREEFQATFDAKLESHLQPVKELLKKHDETITQHDRDIVRVKGVFTFLGVLWTGLAGLFTRYLFYRHS